MSKPRMTAALSERELRLARALHRAAGSVIAELERLKDGVCDEYGRCDCPDGALLIEEIQDEISEYAEVLGELGIAINMPFADQIRPCGKAAALIRALKKRWF